jgi:hypothetical protein
LEMGVRSTLVAFGRLLRRVDEMSWERRDK